MSKATFTSGPWCWRLNPSCKSIRLESPKWCVMSFNRWGMAGATPLFLKDGFMLKAVQLGMIQPGREHHADWHRVLDHPDAHLIAAAPELYAQLECSLATIESAFPDGSGPLWVDPWKAGICAVLAKARGEQP